MKDSWISVREQLPQLPDVPFHQMWVLACNEGDSKSRPMLYQKSTSRGKVVEKWLTACGGATYKIPDYWQPLAAPPKRKKEKGSVSYG